ncbi:MAG: ATPase, T2SS/T4P/T4SS family [Candidatus Micrarchaeaceae archaeon]
MFAFGSTAIGSFLGRKATPEPRRSALSFSISSAEGGDVVERRGGNPERAVLKSGKGYFYSVLLQPSGPETRSMEHAKELVIMSLCSSESTRPPSFGDALREARSRLSGMVPPDRIEQLAYVVAHDTAGYGPISILSEDKQGIEEIEINSPSSPIIVYSARYGRCITNLRFSSETAFRSCINRMIRDSDKEINENTPIIDAQVSDLRIHAQIRPYALSGAAASIRIGGKKEIDLGYLPNNGTATPDILAYLWLAIETKHNMIVSGAPASGKTTLLSALSAFVPANEKVITIEEDINELKGTGVGNTIALYGSRYSSISPKDQVINSLRMRPGRIIIGEMRGGEAKDLFMGANIGISFAATMHSNDGGLQILKKLMVKPMSVDIKGLSALDLAIYMKQSDVNRRSISDIFEYKWLSRAETEGGTSIDGEDMVNVDSIASGSCLAKASLKDSKVIASYSRVQGISQKESINELERRSRLISGSFKEGGGPGAIESAVSNYPGW